MKYLLLLIAISCATLSAKAFDYKNVYDNSINNLSWKYLNPNNKGKVIGWYDGRTLMSLMVMYRSTKDINYLKTLIQHGDSILQKRNDINHLDYDGVNRLGWVDVADECNLEYSWVVHAGMITYPLADFAQLVINSPNDPNTPDLTNYSYNGKTFLQYANEFFSEIKTVVDSYNVDWSPFYKAYKFPTDFSSNTPECFNAAYSTSNPLPYNMSNAMGRTLLMMAKADVNGQFPGFLDKATKLAEEYKKAIDQAVSDGGINHLLYNHSGTNIPGVEDVNHGGISIGFVKLFYDNGIVFNSSYLDLFANHFSSSLYISPTSMYSEFNSTHISNPDTLVGFYEWLGINDNNLDLYRYIEDAIVEDLVTNKLFADGRKLLGLSYLQMYKVKLWPVSYSRGNGPDAGVADLHLGDLDGDGKDELVTVRNFDGHIDAYNLNMDGSLNSYAYNYNYGSASQWAGVTVGNFDVSTPEEEIAAVRNYDGKIFIWKANSNGTLSVIASLNSGSSSQWAGIEAGDFDPNTPGDELALVRNFDGDIFLYKYVSGSLSLIDRNYGPGSASNWIDLTSGDFNGDGKDEIIGLRGYDEKLYVYEYDVSTGKIISVFSEQLPAGGNYKAITAGDFDGDNNIELAVQFGISGNLFFYEFDGTSFTNDWTEYWSTGDNIYALGSGKFRTDQTGCEVFFVRGNQNIFGYTAGRKKIVINPRLKNALDNTTVKNDVKRNVSVYPNPSQQTFIQLSTPDFDLNSNYSYEIIDVSGKVVKKLSYYQGAVIDLSEIPQGLFFLRLNFQGDIITKKLIVQ